MSSLSPKERVSLCSFTFSDGRRCRTPRTGKNPRFCFYHAQKEARAAKKLGKDLAYFFSGDYLSACDLSTAPGRLIPAVVRGDVKPKTAHTVAYLAQTLLQAIHISQHEYINAFGTNGWRKSIRNSVNSKHDYLFPPARTRTVRATPTSTRCCTSPPLTPPVIMSVAKDLIPSPRPHSLGRLCQPPSPTTHRGPDHPLRNLPQIGTPAHSISNTVAASSSTANPFRINTHTAARNC